MDDIRGSGITFADRGTAELKGIRVTGVCSRSSRKRLRRMDAW
jgi:hypothetical protein